MALTFKKVKCYLACILLFVFSYHIVNTCPLGTPIDYELIESDHVCKVSHQVYSQLVPYVAPLASQVHQVYEDSPVKPIVSNATLKISKTYGQYGKPTVDKYYPVVSSHVGTIYGIAEAKFLHCYAIVAAHAVEKGEIYGEILKIKALEFYRWAYHALNYKVLPRAYIYGNIIKSWVSEHYHRAVVWGYLNYHLHIHPRALHHYEKFLDSPAGPYWTSFLNSVFYQYTKQTFLLFIDGLRYAFTALHGQYVAFKNNELDFSEELQGKTAFVKQEFNKLFESGFKMPNHEDYAMFKKMSSEAVVSSVSSTTPTTSVIASATSEALDSVSTVVSETIISSESVVRSEQTSSVAATVVSAATAGVGASAVYVTPEFPANDVDPVNSTEKYNSLLKKVIDGALNDLDTELHKISTVARTKISEEPKEKLIELSNLVIGVAFQDVHEMLAKINDKSADPQISRQDYRDILAKHAKLINDAGDASQNKALEIEEEYKKKVTELRENILDGFSEFSESILTAYSSEIVNNGDQWDEWKKFNETKKELMSVRDKILTSDPTQYSFKKDVLSLKRDIHVLVNEGQSYLAILRAKGNLEFQSREKEEREKEKKAKAGENYKPAEDEKPSNDHATTISIVEPPVMNQHVEEEEPITSVVTVTLTETMDYDEETPIPDGEEHVVTEVIQEYVQYQQYGDDGPQEVLGSVTITR
ncbi:unnamed protein product [Ambrosiozyma monospora]|uniref:Unnamed protein product n=1 Tax=Ambrosiozyma monospora TaxID=43982 RepID=A0A9W7DHB8_AMBMO|nr:unnamed protein product [Ambrosiozyma monospora]